MLITNYQLPLIIFCFAVGSILTVLLFRNSKGHRAWRVADLVWVLLGGFGALVAVISGIYAEDSSRIDRQIDLAYAATRTFDSDAARFRLRYCETPSSSDIRILCDKIEFLSASTAGNAALPLFIGITRDVAPLQGLHFYFNRPQNDMPDMVQAANDFDPTPFLAFTTFDDETFIALTSLRTATADVAADFQVLAENYDDLIKQVGMLKTEWEVLQANTHILVLQIIAICLVSFAAPFRLGKSIADLRR